MGGVKSWKAACLRESIPFRYASVVIGKILILTKLSSFPKATQKNRTIIFADRLIKAIMRKLGPYVPKGSDGGLA